MQKEMIDKANKIMSLIEENEKAVAELEKYAETGKTLYISKGIVCMPHGMEFTDGISFEDWEIRLMIHQKKQRINALKVQLEKL